MRSCYSAKIFQERRWNPTKMNAMGLSKLHESRLTVFATAMGKSLYEGLGFGTQDA